MESEVTAAGVEAARQRLGRQVPTGPCFSAPGLARLLHAEVWLKVETLNPIASFKVRGALNALLAASDKETIRGAVTSSTGNHGQGVAFAAKSLGIPAHIFLPVGANPAKRARIEQLGAHIQEVGNDIDEAKAEALRFARREGLYFVDDGESLEMCHGAGTIGLEITEQAGAVDTVYVPMGSGTLASGVACAVKSRDARASVVAVQAAGAPAMALSFRAKRPVEHAIDTIADGLVCRVPARLALAAINQWVDDVVTVTDEEILSAMRTLVEAAGILAEPSGAAALAGAWKHRGRSRGGRVALVITGANVRPEILAEALKRPGLISPRDRDANRKKRRAPAR